MRNGDNNYYNHFKRQHQQSARRVNCHNWGVWSSPQRKGLYGVDDLEENAMVVAAVGYAVGFSARS